MSNTFHITAIKVPVNFEWIKASWSIKTMFSIIIMLYMSSLDISQTWKSNHIFVVCVKCTKQNNIHLPVIWTHLNIRKGWLSSFRGSIYLIVMLHHHSLQWEPCTLRVLKRLINSTNHSLVQKGRYSTGDKGDIFQLGLKGLNG